VYTLCMAGVKASLTRRMTGISARPKLRTMPNVPGPLPLMMTAGILRSTALARLKPGVSGEVGIARVDVLFSPELSPISATPASKDA
jgi:hypothetical protein